MKKIKDKTKRYKAFLDTLFENVLEGIVIADKKGKILQANQHFLDIFGYKKNEVLGKLLDELITSPKERKKLLSLPKKWLMERTSHSKQSVLQKRENQLMYLFLLPQ